MTQDGESQATDKFLEPQEDGLPMRESGKWVVEKLDYVARYLNAFLVAMRDKGWRGLNYIDLFAGPGKCRVRGTRAIHLGSPLIALTARYEFSHYYFAERSSEDIDALRTRCSASPRGHLVHCYQGDSNVLVHDILRDIREAEAASPKGRFRSALNLAFLDPQGLELAWETVAALAGAGPMDLIIHYSRMGISREARNELTREAETALDRFFGDRGWREIWQSGRVTPELQGKLLEHYKSKLRGLGYVDLKEHAGSYDPVIRNVKRAPLYRLVFASKHALGAEFWAKVTSRDAYGQLRFLEPRATY